MNAARGGAGAPASVAFFPPAASTLLNHRRGKSTEALADDLVKACDDLLAAGKRINWIFLGAPGVGPAGRGEGPPPAHRGGGPRSPPL